MKIIRPTAITDAMLTATDVPEADYTAWSNLTTYSAAQRCIVTTPNVHTIYESLAGGNLNHDPVADCALETPLYWKEVGPTNRWKVFDAKVGSQTSKATSMYFTLSPGIIDSLALLNMDATSVQIVMTDPTEGEVYNSTIDLISTANVIDAYTYCFEPIIRTTDVVLLDLPPYGSASITITITHAGGTAKCGAIIVGMKSNIGTTLRSTSVGITDYSTKQADESGNYTILKRANAKRGSYDVQIPNYMIDEIHRLLTESCSEVVVWIGIEGKTSTYSYGFYKDFGIVIEGTIRSVCNIEIVGLT